MEAQLRQLILQKDTMEKQIQNLTIQLDLINETKNYDKNLTDSQGFPRADIDFGQLSSYKSLKKRKAELNNDHLALMKEIQKKLFALHASNLKGSSFEISQTTESKGTVPSFKKEKKEIQKQEQAGKKKIDYLTPFAKISIVFQGSPASIAGLKVGDLLSELAEINIYSLDWQKQVAGVVREGTPLRIVVMRPVDQQVKSEKPTFKLKDGKFYQKLQQELTPGKWEGRGLLGCKIDPLNA